MAKRDASPQATIIGVGAVVFRGEDVLLIRRGKPPFEGEWSIPGGRLHYGERLEDAVRREVMEETAVSIGDLRQLATFEALPTPAHQGHIVMVDYVARWRAGAPIAGDDALEAAFLPFDEAQRRLSWDTTRRALALAQDLLKSAAP